jgi:3-oxoacyl-[acyl-carrier-protein] synthase-3
MTANNPLPSPRYAARIVACGAYLPENVTTNDDLSGRLDTSDEWISSRTGIRQRHIAGAQEGTSFMAAEAAKRACDSAGVSPKEVGLIIVATTTPDRIFPSVAVDVQHRIGAGNSPAFDMQAVCSGFVYALSVADAMLARSPHLRYALVIGAEKMSAVLDWEDRNTCVLFGDGAGAVLLAADRNAPPKRGLMDFTLHADGSLQDILYTDGGAAQGRHGLIRMQGKEVFRHASRHMADAVSLLLERNGLTPSDIGLFVPHQANRRIMDMVAKALKLEEAQVASTVALHANTSAASIPLALDVSVREGRLPEGTLIALVALGGGLTWGGALAYWG